MGAIKHICLFNHISDTLRPLGTDHLVLLAFFHLVVKSDHVHLFLSKANSLHKSIERQVKPSKELLNLSHPNTFSVLLGHFLHPPEPLQTEDGSPLLLEEDPDKLDEVDHHAALEAQTHVVWAHVEAAINYFQNYNSYQKVHGFLSNFDTFQGQNKNITAKR